MPLEINLQIDEPLQEAWNDLTAQLARRFTREIRAEQWPWPNEPSPRDIVDTGNLAKSLRISQSIQRGALQSTFQWTAPYSAWVHDGAVYKRTDANGNPMTMTARPWTRPVLYDREWIQRYFALRFALAMKQRRTTR